MKKLTQVLVVLLVFTTGFLGYKVYDLSNQIEKLDKTESKKEISTIVSEFETDVTRVVQLRQLYR